MRKIYLLFILLTFTLSFNAQVQLDWAQILGQTNSSTSHSKTMAIDMSDNIYITGRYYGTLDFDPGPGVFNMTSSGVDLNSFIQKFDAEGNFIWAKSIGGTADVTPHSITTDNMGNLLLTGLFDGIIDLDPGSTTFNINTNGSDDIFILKLDSGGNFIWANSFGSTLPEENTSIITDNFGNIYVSGGYRGTVDFNPGAGVFNMTSNGQIDVFILKLDINGSFMWSKSIGSTKFDTFNSITCNSSGSVYITGSFLGTVDFDPGSGTFNLVNNSQISSSDAFILKLSANGDFVWAKANGDASTIFSKSIAVDNFGGLYVYGTYYQTIDFNPNVGSFMLTSNGAYDTYIQKLDTNGNFIWAKSIGGNSIYNDDATTIITDSYGNIYLTGDYLNIVDFDPGPGGYPYGSFGEHNICTIKLDSNGSFKRMTAIETTDYDNGARSIALDSQDNLITYGAFESSGYIDFDPSSDTMYLASLTAQRAYLQKLRDCYVSASYTMVNNGSGNYSFTNTSSGRFSQSHWAFGDGTISTTTNPNHTFGANGNYVIVLTLNDSSMVSSCTDYYIDSTAVTGVVNPTQCAAGFVMYPDTSTGNIMVVNSSTGSNLTYFWNFGDGDTSSLQNPNHTYSTSGPFYLCLTVDDGNSCIDTYCDSIGSNGVVFKQTGFTINVISPPIITGVNNVEKLISEIKTYPNPTSNQLIIDSEQKINEISIIDITGKTLKVYTTNLNAINVSDLPSGIYFIKLITNEKTITKKLVKQ